MNMSAKMNKPGPLVAIGGAEDKASDADILRHVVSLSGKDTPVVAVITTASSIPAEVFDAYRDAFALIAEGEVLDVRIRNRRDADDEGFVNMIRRADIVFLSGGDQMRLTNVLGASNALEAIRLRRAEGAVVAGTSAGAACQSRTMVYGGQADSALRKGAVRMTAGFGFVDNVVIDTHFLERGRFSRLMEVGATNPEYLGVGLGEDAAVHFDGDILRAFGPGHVILVDSSEIEESNVFDLNEGEPVAVSNVKMHALVEGYGYDLAKGRVLAPDELKAIGLERTVAYT